MTDERTVADDEAIMDRRIMQQRQMSWTEEARQKIERGERF